MKPNDQQKVSRRRKNQNKTKRPSKRKRNRIRAPELYENWKASRGKRKYGGTYEYPIYGDTRLTSVLELAKGCPYIGLNTTGIVQPGTVGNSLVFRADFHLPFRDPDWESGTNVDRYHGGGIEDEFAAILSLLLGARFFAGSYNRWFNVIENDPKGRPVTTIIRKSVPYLPPVYFNRRILPNFIKEKRLDTAKDTFESLLNLRPSQATVLVKAARQYQTGVWIAEAEPELAWLFLVSAIETAAGFWRKKNASAVERFRLSRPKAAERLLNAGGRRLLKDIAEELADYMGATKKFVDFLLYYVPDPPQPRPSMYAVDWSRNSMKKTFNKIYQWRSQALHGGTPFPSPMCDAPEKNDDGSYSERPQGLASMVRGGLWNKEDVPMLFHVFEYIVRNALLSWWKSMTMTNTTK